MDITEVRENVDNIDLDEIGLEDMHLIAQNDEQNNLNRDVLESTNKEQIVEAEPLNVIDNSTSSTSISSASPELQAIKMGETTSADKDNYLYDIYNDSYMLQTPEEKYRTYYLLDLRLDMHKLLVNLIKVDNIDSLAKFIVLERQNQIINFLFKGICLALILHVSYLYLTQCMLKNVI